MGVFDLLVYLRRQIQFSVKTFGPGDNHKGVIDHIQKELKEIEAKPTDLEEWIDVVILGFDGAWRTGATPEEIAKQLQAKLIKNETRQWPDWKTAQPGKAIEHIRTADEIAATDVTHFDTGAKRGTDCNGCRVALIPRAALRAYGRAFAEGEAKYGRDNWLKGFPIVSLMDHAIEHLYAFLAGDNSEDHLGHAMWNVGSAIHQMETRPELDDRPKYQEHSTV